MPTELLRKMPHDRAAWPTCACSSPSHYPQLRVDVDRTRADQLGLTERDVTNSLVTIAGRQLPDRAGLLAEPEERRLLPDRRPDARSTGRRLALEAARTSRSPAASRATCRCWAAWRPISRGDADAVVTHYAIQPVVRHLRHHPGPRPGRVARDISKVLKAHRQGPAEGRDRRPCAARSTTMNTAFSGLFFGLLGRDRADLPADRRELPVAGSTRS